MTAANTQNVQFWLCLGFPLQVVALHSVSGAVRVLHLNDRDGLGRVIPQARALNADGWNLYYEVNVSAKAGKRSKAGDIIAVRAVVADIDAKEGRTVEQCQEVVAALPLPPSFVVFTGGGLQVIYLLEDRPAATPENFARHEAIGRALASLVRGDAVFDLPRIMRLPGFINHPTPQKAVLGRQPEKVMVEAATGQSYTLEVLAAHFAPQPAAAPMSINDALAAGITGGSTWFDQLSPKDKNACLAAMLQVPAIIALADTSDGAPEPNWRTVVAACARSGALDAHRLCREWAQTSPRFDPEDFETRWKSYADG